MREILKKYTAETNDWLIMNTGAVPYIISFGIRQWTKGVNDRYPENCLIDFCGIRYIKDGAEAQYFTNSNFYYRSFEKLINNLETLESIYADFLNDEIFFKSFIDKIELSGEEYLQINFEEFISAYDAEYISGVTIDGVLVYSEKFYSEMKQKYPDHEKELRALISPYGETFLAQYKKQLLETAISAYGEYANIVELLKNIEIRKGLESIQHSFHWIQNNYKNVDALPIEFFAGQLLELLQKERHALIGELSELNESVEKHQKECAQIKDRNILSVEDFDKLLWIGKIGWWVDRRKKYNLIANYYIGKHLEWLCQKYKLSYADADFLLPSEIEKIGNGNATVEDFAISERKNGGIHMYDIDGNETIISGDEAREFWSIINPEIKRHASDEIRGMIAHKGKICGTVRIVMDAHNPGNFNDGDILVTGMTRPDFLSLMKKAGAFVTDEGGITCHAAIVARELKKPCIIGTRISTQVLQDGDWVEVDADKGIVKILKKKNEN